MAPLCELIQALRLGSVDFPPATRRRSVAASQGGAHALLCEYLPVSSTVTIKEPTELVHKTNLGEALYLASSSVTPDILV